MPPKNSGGSSNSPGGHKVIHTTPQTAFVSVVTPRKYVQQLEEISKSLKYCLGYILKG